MRGGIEGIEGEEEGRKGDGGKGIDLRRIEREDCETKEGKKDFAINSHR